MPKSTRRILAVAALGFALSACQGYDVAKHLKPIPFETKREMDALGMDKNDPILVRIFKEESELEVWKRRDADGRYALLKTYEICAWSGNLGPKHREGDRQAPEGFYQVTPAQMNPNSSYHLSFNMGFPNAYDRSHGRTGSHLMVHGACSSAGCYAMEDPQIEEIYALAREAFRGGQREFQVHAFPFRMTPENMARHADHKYIDFWRMLKEGNDHFEVTRQAPEIGVCGRQYVFNAVAQDGRMLPNAACPELYVPEEIEIAVAQKAQQDEQAFQVALADIRAKEAEQLFEQMQRENDQQGSPVVVAAAPTSGTQTSGTGTVGQLAERAGGFVSNLLPFGSSDDAPTETVTATWPMTVPADAVPLPRHKPLETSAASSTVIDGSVSPITAFLKAEADPFAVFDRFDDTPSVVIFDRH